MNNRHHSPPRQIEQRRDDDTPRHTHGALAMD
jgi:hypothetical protein